MRKTFFLLPLLFACVSSFAGGHFTGQNSWRWRNNDGSEVSATWKAAQGSPVTYSAANGIIRLRIELINRSYLPGPLDTSPPTYPSINPKDTLQYSVSPTVATSWVNVDNNPAKDFVMAGQAAIVVQGEPTTPQITGAANPFNAGLVMVNSSIFTGNTIQPQGRTEVEWAIKGTPHMLQGTMYYFRHRGTTISYLNPYPSLTTASNAPLPVKLTHFSVQKEGKKVRIEWTTATEHNSDRFEILRSADGQTWQATAQVQSVGNATTATNYSAYDDRPLSGLNQYRLKQIDKDGKSFLSDIRSARLFTDAVVSVWPNPASSYVNFCLQQAEVKVVATLQDATGRTVHQETFTNLPASAVNKLAMAQRPPAGVYILRLEAAGFSETRKIIIQ